MIAGVYAIVNTRSDRRYVGSSVNVFARWGKHRCDLRKHRHHSQALQDEWDFYGSASFEFVVLDVVPDFRERLEREQIRLDETDQPYNTLNTAYVRTLPGTVRSPETRRLLSHALRGKRKSPEHRAALGDAKRGRPCPAQSLALRGRKLSPETREKMRIAHTGLKGTIESRAKQSAALKGRVFTPEWKARISAAKLGKTRTPKDTHTDGAENAPVSVTH
jgi:group I intron endonuclease